MVSDAAARFEGAALNKELLQGPLLNNSLVGVLMRFRKDEVAVAYNKDSMFHRVACREDDKDALRFLHCTKNWIYTNLLGANMVQKSAN